MALGPGLRARRDLRERRGVGGLEGPGRGGHEDLALLEELLEAAGELGGEKPG